MVINLTLFTNTLILDLYFPFLISKFLLFLFDTVKIFVFFKKFIIENRFKAKCVKKKLKTYFFSSKYISTASLNTLKKQNHSFYSHFVSGSLKI